MDTPLMDRLKEIKGENRRLKKMNTAERFKSGILKKTIDKNRKDVCSREMVLKSVNEKCVSILLACRMFIIIEHFYRSRAKFSGENAETVDWLIRLTHNKCN